MSQYMGSDALAVKMCGKQIPDDALAKLVNLTTRAKALPNREQQALLAGWMSLLVRH